MKTSKLLTCNRMHYLKTDFMLQLVTENTHSVSKQSYKFKQELNIHPSEENDTNASMKKARDIKKTEKAEGLKQIKQNW